MKLVPNWKRAFRMVSIQAMGAAAAIQGAWVFVPEDMKASLPPDLVRWVTVALLVVGIFGRLVQQKKVSG